MIDVLCCKCVRVAKSVLMMKRHECKEEVCVKTQETQKIHFASVSEFLQLLFIFFFFNFFFCTCWTGITETGLDNTKIFYCSSIKIKIFTFRY